MESTNSSFASDLGQVIIDKLLCDGYTLNKWISVEDALPELNTNVLVYAVGKKECFEDQIAITRYTDTLWFDHEIKTDPYWKDPWQYFHSDYEITHWFPLPSQPNKKEEHSFGIEIDSTPTVEVDHVRKCRCEYCEGRTYTHEPFTVITQKMNQVDVVFNFCPNCGADMRRCVDNG